MKKIVEPEVFLDISNEHNIVPVIGIKLDEMDPKKYVKVDEYLKRE